MSSIIGNKSFPSFDAFHAHCAITVNFQEASCLDSFNAMKDFIETAHPEPGAGGTYKIWDATEEEMIWATRTTPKKKYVDDIMFEFIGDPTDFRAKGCSVKGRSRSQSLSYYDYSTNYCNMWNVMKQVEDSANDLANNIVVSDCKYPAEKPEEVCLKY